jgi:hypothetical protein
MLILTKILCCIVLLMLFLHKSMFFLLHISIILLQSYCESRDAAMGAKAYNGDLAEADQSHHEEPVGDIPELEAESAVAMSVAQDAPSEGQSTQAEGAATADTCIMHNATDAAEVKSERHLFI